MAHFVVFSSFSTDITLNQDEAVLSCLQGDATMTWFASEHVQGVYRNYGWELGDTRQPITPAQQVMTIEQPHPSNNEQFAAALEKIRQRLRPLPDHEAEARRICSHEFIEGILLPRMRDSSPLTALELQRMAIEHKRSFQRQHPHDYDGEFELIPDVAMELITLSLRLHTRLKQEPNDEMADITRIVDRSMREVKSLLDQHVEELSSV
ncbi:MAG: hypothetical protein JNM70_01205 [Anaerolineae bacterium]|nr:hypothetical protein [Anaerolineae bacterium]